MKPEDNAATLTHPTSPQQAIPIRARLFGLLFMVLGIGCGWFNWHEALTTGEFSIKATIFAPLGLFAGLMLALRPHWAGPWGPNTSRAQKFATIAVIVLTAIVGAIDFYLLNHCHSCGAAR